jgi:hypothetical protein
MDPIAKETRISAQIGIFRSGPELKGFISIDEPATNKTREKPVKMNFSLKLCAISEVEIFEIRPIPQITIASLIKTSLLFNFGITPDDAASNTTASAAVVA